MSTLIEKLEAMAQGLEGRRMKDGSPYECGLQNQAQADARRLRALIASAREEPGLRMGKAEALDWLDILTERIVDWTAGARMAKDKLTATLSAPPPGDGGLRELLARIKGLSASLERLGLHVAAIGVRNLPIGLPLNAALGGPAQTQGIDSERQREIRTALMNSQTPPPAPSETQVEEPLSYCDACNKSFATHSPFCPLCGGPLEDAPTAPASKRWRCKSRLLPTGPCPHACVITDQGFEPRACLYIFVAEEWEPVEPEGVET